jgi:hypothetical protein
MKTQSSEEAQIMQQFLINSNTMEIQLAHEPGALISGKLRAG